MGLGGSQGSLQDLSPAITLNSSITLELPQSWPSLMLLTLYGKVLEDFRESEWMFYFSHTGAKAESPQGLLLPGMANAFPGPRLL